MGEPRQEWCESTCAVCPAQELGPGDFDVVDRPGPQYAYEPTVGWRIDRATRAAICVHPYRVGLPPGRYATDGEPVPPADTARPLPSPVALELPEALEDLEGWIVAHLRVASDDGIFHAVARAERIAWERFAPDAVTKALRRVLNRELAER